jgi:hypothetical protein
MMTELTRALCVYALACLVGYLIAGGLIAMAWPS